MPRNAISSDLVDAVLPVADIPASILEYKKNIDIIRIPVEVENRLEDQQNALREIFAQLRIRTGHDFANYKRPRCCAGSKDALRFATCPICQAMPPGCRTIPKKQMHC